MPFLRFASGFPPLITLAAARERMAWVFTYRPYRFQAVDLAARRVLASIDPEFVLPLAEAGVGGRPRTSMDPEPSARADLCGEIWVLSVRNRWVGCDAKTLAVRWRGVGQEEWRVAGATVRELVLHTPEGLRCLDPRDGSVTEPFLAAPAGALAVASLRDGMLITCEDGASAFVGAAREERWSLRRPSAADTMPRAFALDGSTWLTWSEETRAGPETVLIGLDERTGESFTEHRIAGAFEHVTGAGNFAAGVQRETRGVRAFAWTPEDGGTGGDRAARDSVVSAVPGIAIVAHHGFIHVARSAPTQRAGSNALRWGTKGSWDAEQAAATPEFAVFALDDRLQWMPVEEVPLTDPETLELRWKYAGSPGVKAALPRFREACAARGLAPPELLERFVGRFDTDASFRFRLERLGWNVTGSHAVNPVTQAPSPGPFFFAASDTGLAFGLVKAGGRPVFATTSGASAAMHYAGSTMEEFLGRCLLDLHPRQPSLVARILEDLEVPAATLAIRTPEPADFSS